MGRARAAKPWPDARCDAPLPPLREPVTGKPRLDVAEILRGKHILLIGTTGFVGKVALSMLLHRYPDVGRVYCLVRPGAGNTADERFFKKVATSARRSIRCATCTATATRRSCASKIVALAGDIGRPLLQLHRRAVRRASAGRRRSSTAPAWCRSRRRSRARCASTRSARRTCSTSRASSARGSCHVSTCYVAGQRDGEVWEDEPVVGYFPRSKAIARDCGRRRRRCSIATSIPPPRSPTARRSSIRRASGRTTASTSRSSASRAREALRDAAPRSRRRERSQDRRRARAQDLDERRADQARHGARARTGAGPTRTRTRSRSASRSSSADRTVASTIVRPAIVESACAIRSRAGTRASTRPRR